MKKMIALTLAFIMTLSLLAGCGGNGNAPSESDPPAASGETPSGKAETEQTMVYGVGEVAEANGLSITIDAAEPFDFTGMLSRPRDGFEYLKVWFTFKNVSDKAIESPDKKDIYIVYEEGPTGDDSDMASEENSQVLPDVADRGERYMSSDELAPGESTGGWMVYQKQTAQDEITMHYYSGFVNVAPDLRFRFAVDGDAGNTPAVQTKLTSEPASGRVSPDSEKTIGDAAVNGVELVVPAETFAGDVNVSIGITDENAVTADMGASFLSSPIQLSSDGGEHVLGESVTVRFKLPESVGENDYLTIMGAYHDGADWEYILPDFEGLEDGYLVFRTPHFSTFAPVKLEKEKALDKYAETLAVQNVTGSKPSDEIDDCFTETLEKMGFTDKTVQGVIMQKIAKENDYTEFITNAKNGDAGDIAGQGAALIASALLKATTDKGVLKKVKEAAEAISSGSFAATMELLEGGKVGDAYKEFVYSAMDYFPAARLGKAAVEATKAGAEMWQDYSVESAYKVYLNQSVSSDGSISADSWDIIFYNMGSGLDFLKREYRAAYAANHGMTVKELEADKKLRDRLDGLVEDDVKHKFMTRYTNTAAVEAEKAEIMEQLRLFDEHGLLDPDSFLKFSHDMSLADRINSLIKIRQNIIDLVGGELSVFGTEGSDKNIEDNLAFAVKMWLLCGKDRARFYDWMRENGYLKSLGKPAEGGYWQLVRSFENKFETSRVDDAYSESWSGGGGSYTYNCKTTFDHHYTGSTHNTCRGEFVNNTGTASSPDSRYAGGEQVRLDLSISAATSSNICFHLGANLTSCITEVNKDDPFLNYGTDVYFQNVNDENARGDVSTYKNDTNTGYIGGSVTSGAAMPMGYEDGDKVYILIIFTGGNNLIKTAYEYEWHS